MEGQKATESIATQESKLPGRGLSGSSGTDDRQDKKVGLAFGLLGSRSKRHDVRRPPGRLLFQRLFGVVLYAAGVGRSGKDIRSIDLGFWLWTWASVA